MRRALRTGLALAEETLALAEDLGEPHILALASFRVGNIRSFMGEFAAARRHLEKGLVLYDPERDRVKAARFGQDARMACHSQLGIVLRQQGFPDEALWHAEEGIAAARAASHPLSEAFALVLAACVHQSRGELALCLERAEGALALATEQMLPFWAGYAMVLSGWALVENGQAEKGLERLRAGLDAGLATGHKATEPYWLALFVKRALRLAGSRKASQPCAKGSPRSSRPRPALARRSSTGSKAIFFSPPRSPTKSGQRPPFARQSQSPAGKGQDPSSYGRRRASPGSWRARAGAPRRATSSRPSTAGLPKASTPPI